MRSELSWGGVFMRRLTEVKINFFGRLSQKIKLNTSYAQKYFSRNEN
jgi:hypothetical protein